MTKLKSLLLAIATLLAVPGFVQAQASAHYCPGVLGIMAGSAPPPGVYAVDYNVFYTADRLNDASGHSAGPPNFSAFAYAQVPRFVWVTDEKLLGADFGISILIPIVEQSLRAGTYNNSTFGVGDLLTEGFLSWHLKRFDFLAAGGVWSPTGDSPSKWGPSTCAGKGYWGGMISLGGTYYITEDKAWAISLFNRYEINSEQRDTHITPGQAETVEWGISRNLPENFDAGIAGYFQGQVTTDSGAANLPGRNRVAAVGPEIGGVIPKIDVSVSVRYLYEFMAENRAQGQTVTLSLVKRF